MKKTLIGMLLIGLSCHAQTGGFTAQLETTPGKILTDEYWAMFKVTLSNGTPSAIRVYQTAGAALDRQVFFGLGNQEHHDFSVRGEHLRKAHTTSWQYISANTFSNTCWVNPGGTHTWDFSGMFNLFFIPQHLEVNQTSVYAQVLVGPDQWMNSNTNTVSFSELGCDDGPILFTRTFSTPLGMKSTHARAVTVDGEPFLFYGCRRLCNLTGLGTPTITADPVISNILTFDFGTNAPSFRFNTKTGEILP